MGRTVKLMVACGSGIATSTHAASMVQEYMEERHIPVSIMTCSVQDLANRLSGCDVILSTAQVSFESGLPVFNGVPLLTGVGDDELLKELADKILEISNTVV
ncbi:hypothetical protein C3B58_07560 [Lactonifactor longoviformis]|uniref:PTS system, galactitol-specific IIB component n=1 Tax=Lactonifactor longoviformis DSM 17459 TaxID=1122155 RepID=A0A1M5BX76_9CLOT|nr:PTS sugar transporter subunit IIB [Lactonifactor longoviformis]POP33416.1 hypothetical protein C3B58_07560 [Lactonifactor longoviformis]SHF47011.1 PTS system, galactitol-specific IIB component [Lactonifactor longoviformis DSM 17459]